MLIGNYWHPSLLAIHGPYPTYIILFMDNVDCASKCVNCAQTFHNIQESGAMKNVVLKYLNIGS